MATVLTKTQITEAQAIKSRNPILSNMIPVGSHQQDTSISAATTITPSDTATRFIMLQNSDPSVIVRYTLEGTDPTSTFGFKLDPGFYLLIATHHVTLKVIETSAGGQVDWQELV